MGHASFIITDDEHFVWLKLHIDATNIMATVDNYVSDILQQEFNRMFSDD